MLISLHELLLILLFFLLQLGHLVLQLLELLFFAQKNIRHTRMNRIQKGCQGNIVRVYLTYFIKSMQIFQIRSLFLL